MYQKRDFGSRMFLLILVTSGALLSSGNHETCFLRIPKPILYVEEGRDITVIWYYHIEARPPSGTKIADFLFGEWSPPGYVKYKILYLDSHHKVQARPGYGEKVLFQGNFSQCANCSARVTIRKLTEGDFKKYGIDILVGLHRSPLTNSFELRAPPKITMFSSDLKVHRGNKTSIGCKAKGIPAPFVKIQRNNETLCNDTLHCQYIIKKVDIEDEGEYECIAEQGEKAVNSSMKLMVLSRKDNLQSTTETSNTLVIVLAVSVSIVVLLIVAAAVVILLRKRKNKKHEFEKVDYDVNA